MKFLIAILIFLVCFATIAESAPQPWYRCTAKSREGDVCPEYYTDTCGYRPYKSKRYTKYGNPCFACHDKNVIFYTLGKCP